MIGLFVGPFSRYLVTHYMIDSQNDMLMLLMSKTQKVGMSLDGLARRLLFVNFAGTFSASMASDHISSPPYDAILNIACQ